MASILLVGRQMADYQLALAKEGHVAITAGDIASAQQYKDRFSFDLVVCARSVSRYSANDGVSLCKYFIKEGFRCVLLTSVTEDTSDLEGLLWYEWPEKYGVVKIVKEMLKSAPV